LYLIDIAFFQVSTPVATTPPTPGSAANKDMLDNVRKCKNFLSTLLKLASNQPAATVQNVKNLIQGLVVSS
jgi:transcription initiation factor TFIID subunit 4